MRTLRAPATRTSRVLRSRVLIAAAALAAATQAALIALVLSHDLPSGVVAAHSDFASSWLGGFAWRTAGPSHAFDVPLQAALYQHVAPGAGPLVYPNTWAPMSLLLTIPFSLIALRPAFDLWLLLQGALLVTAAWVAARTAAPHPRRRVVLLAAAAGVLSAGTVGTVLFGQWDGVAALGVAVGYALWSRGNEASAAAVVTVLLLSGKPHLALALLAFTLGRGSRRAVAGCVLGLAITAVVDLALVQVTGVQGWLHTVGAIATMPAAASLSVFGFFAITLGTGMIAEALSVMGAIALAMAGAVLGRLSYYRPRLEICLAAATGASLLISPHLFIQDFALLVPVAAALIARELAQGCRRRAAMVTIVVALLSLAAEYQILPFGAQRADAAPALLLMAFIGLALLRMTRGRVASHFSAVVRPAHRDATHLAG